VAVEQKELREWEARCIQEEPPACRAGCPLAVDGRAFALAMGENNMAAARAILEKSMPLSGIVGRMCEALCEQYCLRKDLGGSIALGALERVCVETTPVRGKVLRLPPRPKKVVIVGGGPSSLVVAFDLAKKGYPVSLYHGGDQPGAWLRAQPETLLPAKVIEEELRRLAEMGVTFLPLSRVDAGVYDGAGSVYIGRDDELPPGLTDLAEPDRQTFALPKSGWFTGGMSHEEHVHRFITDISEGREAAVSMDRFMQGASLTASRVGLRHGETALYNRTEGVVFQERIIPSESSGYTPEEAVLEAGRCLDCQCLECVKHCQYLENFGGYPKTYARRVYNNSAIVKGIHQANTFINSCSLCRQCETLCPKGFSMADLCLKARQTMVREDRMPPSAHWFALEEMRSARNDGALAHHALGMSTSETLFFPGCQLAGIRPEQTLGLYDHLLELESKTGIWLDCCAAPAHWAGRNEEFKAILVQLENIWRELGRPRVVTACSTCLQMFREHLPVISVESVWTVLAKHYRKPVVPRAAVALTDPCTSRHDKQTRTAVRKLLEDIGQPVSPLPMSGEFSECCGFGGLMESANPKLARKVVAARVAQTDADMLTYCAMCRDQLASTGKPVLHILDLLFADLAHPATEAPASISARRIHRRRLKAKILSRYSPKERPAGEPWEALKLVLSEPVVTIMEERRILEDDIRQVLYQADKRGSCFVHDESGGKIASAGLGEVTFWVQYHEEEGAFCIERCWSHRMVIRGGNA
jgi:Fe-S oxidoreductase